MASRKLGIAAATTSASASGAVVDGVELDSALDRVEEVTITATATATATTASASTGFNLFREGFALIISRKLPLLLGRRLEVGLGDHPRGRAPRGL